jgi:toxin YhaV
LQQLEKLVAAVGNDKSRDSKNFAKKANAKLLKAISDVAFQRIPADPTNPRFRLGGTLGPENKHWFRDKFGNGRFRLFFRFDTRSKVIIYAWANDENSLREYGARTDAYAVFAKMLGKDNPPATWAELLAASQDTGRLKELFDRETD